MIGLIKSFNQNPIYIKDQQIQKRLTSRNKLSIPPWLGYLTILLLPLIMYSLFSIKHPSFDVKDMRSIFIVTCFLQVIYFCYRGVSHSYNLITHEKEMKTYGNLISTMMSPREIVKGKFWMSFYPLAKELTIFFPLFFFIGFLLKVSIQSLIMIYIFGLIQIGFLSIVGLFFSARSRDSMSARSSAIGTLAFMVFGTYLIGILLSMASGFIAEAINCSSGGMGFMIMAIPIGILNIFNPVSNTIAALLPTFSNFIQNLMDISTSMLIGFVYPVFCMVVYFYVGMVIFKKTVKKVAELPS
ncbi:MAG: hypothetical protein K8T10_05395 [Candidatus Eremiobacteraeota bacterium]|nr:hypothetical protein [Candidatus Eremiobacteraeota bacterium]